MPLVVPNVLVDDTLIEASKLNQNFNALAFAVDSEGDTLTGTLQTQVLEPSANNTYDLGTVSLGYKDLYLTGTIHGVGLIPSGVYLPYGGTSAPSGWLLCDGSAVSRATYSGLFTAISTRYGVGDGVSTFNVPDMRDRVPVGAGGSLTTVGGIGGAINHAHTVSVAAHTHPVNTSNHTHTGPLHSHTYSGSSGSSANIGSVDVQFGAGVTVAADGHTHSFTLAGTTSVTGDGVTSSAGGESLTSGSGGAQTPTSSGNNQAYTGGNYIIKT